MKVGVTVETLGTNSTNTCKLESTFTITRALKQFVLHMEPKLPQIPK